MTVVNKMLGKNFLKTFGGGFMVSLICFADHQVLAQANSPDMKIISESIEAGVKETRFDLEVDGITVSAWLCPKTKTRAQVKT